MTLIVAKHRMAIIWIVTWRWWTKNPLNPGMRAMLLLGSTHKCQPLLLLFLFV